MAMTELMTNEQDAAGIAPILTMVEAGQANLLTDEEFALYSDYADEHFTSKDVKAHNANLAEALEETNKAWLGSLATDVIEWVETDEQSRKDWEDKESRGIRLLGVSTETVGGGNFKGASKATHPLLAEATVQFQARAIAEMWPPTGPVRTVVMGDTDDEKESQALRVEGYMNHQYTNLMPGAFEEEDKLLFRLPISGSCFKKIAYDPLEGTLVARFVEPSNMIVPYAAADLRSAPRYTERYEESGNDTLKKIAGGIYRDIVLLDPSSDIADDSQVRTEIDSTEGITRVEYEGDDNYIRYETYCLLDVPGFEDVDKKGDKTGVSLPYIVSVDKDQQQVLAIRRGWKEGDKKKRKRVFHIHYKFLPGLGFYGYGYLHVIGGLGEAATGALRASLDAAGFANMQGGYRSVDAKLKGGDKPVGMGQWHEVDASPEEMRDAFITLPYKEPSKALIELLGILQELGTRFASTTENMVGEASNNGPVGTTLALIEQGSKVFSGIHLRLHKAHEREFKLLADLNTQYTPKEYPYDVPGESRLVKQADFDKRIDVIPVSDPNTISNTQRIARNQAVLELADKYPDLYDERAANTAMLESLRVPNIEEVMPSLDELQPIDPISENSNIMVGKPIQVFPEQDHGAHMAVHESWWITLQKEDQERLIAQYTAHMAEHKSIDYRLHMESIIGPLDQQDAQQIEQAASQAAQIYVGEAGVPEQEQDPMAQAMADEQRKDLETSGNIKRKDVEATADIRRQNDMAAAEIERLAGKEIQKAAIETASAEVAMQDIPGNGPRKEPNKGE